MYYSAFSGQDNSAGLHKLMSSAHLTRAIKRAKTLSLADHDACFYSNFLPNTYPSNSA